MWETAVLLFLLLLFSGMSAADIKRHIKECQYRLESSMRQATHVKLVKHKIELL
jgi:hypothetical protein